MNGTGKFCAVWAIAVGTWAFAADPEEHLSFAYRYADDGGCAEAGHSIAGGYRRESEPLGIFAHVRSAPSGGDCTTASLSYTVDVERRFPLGETAWSGIAKFAADKRSTSAAYALTDGDRVIPRADGMPLFATFLPAGAAETVGGMLGAAVDVGRWQFDIAGNVVPVDWADGSKGRTLHFAVSGDVVGLDVNASVDIGHDVFGDARIAWAKPLFGAFDVQVALGYQFGLNAIDDGAPAVQFVQGAKFLKAGAPQDGAVYFDVGLRVRL